MSAICSARADDGGDSRLHPPHYFRRDKPAEARRRLDSTFACSRGKAPIPPPPPNQNPLSPRRRRLPKCSTSRKNRTPPPREDSSSSKERRPPPKPVLKPEWTPSTQEALVSEPVAHKTAGELGKLMGSMFVSTGNTLDDVVRQLLKPMLKEWLDANLPQIVEAEVAKEIDRIRRMSR